MNFSYNDFKFKKHGEENWLVATGEITNNAGRDYHAVVFRILIFIRTITVGNVNFIINGFRSGQTRTFEVRIGELDYKKIPEISRYEIYAESAY